MRRVDEIAGHALVSEKALEAYLVGRVGALGGVALKYSNPAQAGYPDRLVLLPGGRVLWVELKSRGKKPRPLQVQRHEQLRRLGQEVCVADSRERVDEILEAQAR